MTVTGHTKNYSCYFDCDCGWMNCVEVRGQLALANSSFHHVRPEDQTQVIKREIIDLFKMIVDPHYSGLCYSLSKN